MQPSECREQRNTRYQWQQLTNNVHPLQQRFATGSKFDLFWRQI